MNLRNIDQLNKIEAQLTAIRDILNPEDAPYICDTIVTNIADSDLKDLIDEMLKRMGYRQKIVLRIEKIIKEIQK